MRTLYHPPVDQITVDGILYALADPVRAQIFIQLAKSECARNCSTFLHIQESPLPKSTLSQHFKILREAGLVRSERKGVELINSTRCEELKGRFGAMIRAVIEAYERQGEGTKKG
jgi:DNA-binding transcriptional ArsR family regulator